MNRRTEYFTFNNIKTRFVIDVLIATAYNKKVYIKDSNIKFINIMRDVFNHNTIKDFVYYHNIVFNETLWRPEDENSKNNIIQIDFGLFGSRGKTKLIIDLRKDISHYENIWHKNKNF